MQVGELGRFFAHFLVFTMIDKLLKPAHFTMTQSLHHLHVAATWHGSSCQAGKHVHWFHAHLRHVLDRNLPTRTLIELKFSVMSLLSKPLGLSCQSTSNSKSHFFSKFGVCATLRGRIPQTDTQKQNQAYFIQDHSITAKLGTLTHYG